MLLCLSILSLVFKTQPLEVNFTEWITEGRSCFSSVELAFFLESEGTVLMILLASQRFEILPPCKNQIVSDCTQDTFGGLTDFWLKG